LHLNARKEGPDDVKELAVDVKMNTLTDASVADFFEPELAKFMFIDGGAVRNTMMGAMTFANELEHYRLEAMGSTFHGVKVKKFSLAPRDGRLIDFTLSVSFKPSGDEVARLAEYLQDEIDVTLTPSSEELDFGGDKDASGAFNRLADSVAKDGASMTITDGAGNVLIGAGNDHDPLYPDAVKTVATTGRASISAVQRGLRIGYNRAARLIEQMEKDGYVSAMSSNGSRDVMPACKTGKP
jgi:hypothetical protein